MNAKKTQQLRKTKKKKNTSNSDSLPLAIVPLNTNLIFHVETAKQYTHKKKLVIIITSISPDNYLFREKKSVNSIVDTYTMKNII